MAERQSTGQALTEQQRKWFASVRESLAEKTGRSLDEWAAVARDCPEEKHRAKLAWFKEHHGLGQNHASVVLQAAAESAGENPRDPDALRRALWSDPASEAILRALEMAVADLPGLVTGQRKSFTAWSNRFAFAAARPVKGGAARVGLALSPDADARLEPVTREGWSERLTAAVTLSRPEDVSPLAELLADAHARS